MKKNYVQIILLVAVLPGHAGLLFGHFSSAANQSHLLSCGASLSLFIRWLPWVGDLGLIVRYVIIHCFLLPQAQGNYVNGFHFLSPRKLGSGPFSFNLFAILEGAVRLCNFHFVLIFVKL